MQSAYRSLFEDGFGEEVHAARVRSRLDGVQILQAFLDGFSDDKDALVRASSTRSGAFRPFATPYLLLPLPFLHIPFPMVPAMVRSFPRAVYPSTVQRSVGYS